MSPLEAGPCPKRRTGVGQRGLVFLDHQVGRIGRQRLALEPRGAEEGRVGEQEMPVAVGHREAERELVEQRLQLRRAGLRFRAPAAADPDPAIEQQHQRGRLVGRRIVGFGRAATWTSVCGEPLRPSRAK